MKIRRMLDMDWKVVIQRTYNEANQCANALTNFGGFLNFNLVLFDVYMS